MILNILLTPRQVRVAGTACMSACQHIARSLLALLLADSVKQLSLPALEQLSLDVLQCEREYCVVCVCVV